MQPTHRLHLAARARAARIVLDTGQAQRDCDAGLGQPQLRSRHSLDARRPARCDETALEQPSNSTFSAPAFQSDMAQELFDMQRVRIGLGNSIQEFCGVLQAHLRPLAAAPKECERTAVFGRRLI